ncbi:MAG: glycosyltransferase family 4 protein [Actinomycetota bacterium]|nr:glycosyltransferase family 4 protein [Actinomycetota bacterium]
MRVLLANPPAYGGHDYHHELARHLSRAGAEVEVVTSHFRFGEEPEPEGYVRREVFYPLSSRVFERSRLRMPLKLLEHPVGMGYLALRKPDVTHLQWLAVPELDRFLLRLRAASVFTAHDPIPRRAGKNLERWRALLLRFDRIVTHSHRGSDMLAELGIPSERLRVIFHPVHPSYPPRRDDGRTLLCFGLIRAYKGIGDAIEAVRRVEGARLLVAGDPVEPIDEWRHQGGDRVEWRLGYLPEAEVERAYADTTVALFPYRPELDQSGALLRALGAGVPAVVYDVGGLAEPVRKFDAGRVVPPGDVDALEAAVRELLDDPSALERARAGARRAREALTWDVAAEKHLELYRELV